jgi:hypothetical protein
MNMKAIVLVVVLLIAAACYFAYSDTYDFSGVHATPTYLVDNHYHFDFANILATPQYLPADWNGAPYDFSYEARLTNLQVPAPQLLLDVRQLLEVQK